MPTSLLCGGRPPPPGGGRLNGCLSREVRRGAQTLTLFKTEISDFPTLLKRQHLDF